jgi:DegV family protein with EDD domain
VRILSKIKILTDSASDITLDQVKEYDIGFIPICLTFDGEKVLEDKYDIKIDEFYKRLRETGDIPKTTQITPGKFSEVFTSYADEYDELIVFLLGSNTSGTFQNAFNAKAEVEEETNLKIHLIDTQLLSMGYGYPAIRAAQMVKEGLSSEEIIAKCEAMIKSCYTLFAVETLDFLKKGGRIKTPTAIIGGMLDIRPILTVADGLVHAIEKVKGEKKVFPKFMDLLAPKIAEMKNPKIIILDSDVPEKAEKLKAIIKEKLDLDVTVSGPVGVIIGAHAGPGVLGVIAIDD